MQVLPTWGCQWFERRRVARDHVPAMKIYRHAVDTPQKECDFRQQQRNELTSDNFQFDRL